MDNCKLLFVNRLFGMASYDLSDFLENRGVSTDCFKLTVLVGLYSVSSWIYGTIFVDILVSYSLSFPKLNFLGG